MEGPKGEGGGQTSLVNGQQSYKAEEVNPHCHSQDPETCPQNLTSNSFPARGKLSHYFQMISLPPADEMQDYFGCHPVVRQTCK